MTNERLIEKALFWLNQVCNDNETINQNADIGRAIKTLQNTKAL